MPYHATIHTARNAPGLAGTRRARIPSARAAAVRALSPRWKTREIWRSGRLGAAWTLVSRPRGNRNVAAADLGANLGCHAAVAAVAAVACIARSKRGAFDRALRTRFNFAKVRLKSPRPSYADAHNFASFKSVYCGQWEYISRMVRKTLMHSIVLLIYNWSFIEIKRRVVVQSFLIWLYICSNEYQYCNSIVDYRWSWH